MSPRGTTCETLIAYIIERQQQSLRNSDRPTDPRVVRLSIFSPTKSCWAEQGRRFLWPTTREHRCRPISAGTRATTHPTTAVMGSTVTVAISDQGPAGGFNGTLNVTSCTYGGAAVPCSPSSVSCTVAQKGSVTLTFSVGPLPSSVSTAEPLSITLQGTYNGNTYTGAGAGCNVYLLYQTPTAPMTTPWLDVVDDGCTWAYGDNTAAQVARDETLGLYNSGYFTYQSTSAWTYQQTPTMFELKKFLADGPDSPGNCVDVSDYLTIVENSQGLNFQVQQFTGSPLFGDGSFTTNPICPIGDVGFGTLASWVFHQLAFSGGNAFDACAAEQRDLVGNIYKQPPYNWPWQGLWETPQPGGGGTYSYGLVATPLDANGMNTPNPSSSTLPVQGQYTPTVQ